MCRLCVEIQKQNMTVREIARAYKEVGDDAFDGHWIDILEQVHKSYGTEGLEEVSDELDKLFDEELGTL